SKLGQGSTFRVSVPLVQAAGSQGHAVHSSHDTAESGLRASAYVAEAQRWTPSTDTAPCPQSVSAMHALNTQESSPRVLVADDNADMRDYLVRLLAPRYDVVAVADGDAALAESRERVPDIVICDVMMPRLDGFGVLNALRSDERTFTIPVILLS